MSGEEIAEKRTKLKLTQNELAEMLGVSLRTIQNYEAGKVIPSSKHAIIRSFLNSEVSGNVINGDNNVGNFAGNNLIQVTLPEQGTQKIIKPDGAIEITSTALNNQGKEDTLIIKRLNEKIEDQERLINSLNEIIKAKDETIAVLKSQRDK